MSDAKEILLQASKSKRSVNGDILLNIDLSSDEKKFPPDSVTSNIDQYKQYIKEKDASNKYRLVFTINPVCSNVLYNHISEFVSVSGGTVMAYESSGKYISNKYTDYKYGGSNGINRELLIRDTGYSHELCGNFEYRCGIDIFNNHLFRNNEFVIVSEKKSSSTCPTFNTIFDTLREYNGSELKNTVGIGESNKTHLYYKDTFKTYLESLKSNLIERDGWFGFTNPTGIDITNFRHKNDYGTINKVINNKGACEFVDLYPDRTLFSFLPKKNTRLHREEFNWDYCLTYPYKNYTGNTLVTLIGDEGESLVNGILTYFCDSNGNKLTGNFIENLLSLDGREESSDILLRTNIKNNIKTGDYVKIHLVGERRLPMGKKETMYYSIKTNIKVRNVGVDGYSKMYYFTVSKGDLLSGLKTIKNLCRNRVSNLRCYVQRVSNGRPCKYYFREFKRLPNLKNTNIYNIDGLNDDAINKVCLNNFNSSLNKLGFGTNIYGDRMAQIVFNDDVDTTNIYDNLGRPLHEIYLTIVKANRGYKTWYIEKSYSYNGIECSHCFGNVSSGIDMPWPYDVIDEQDDYNVHKIHGVENSDTINPKFPTSVKKLESSITINGSGTLSINGAKGLFFGDIVELDELNVEEYVLEDVQHRFNTVQRETVMGQYSALTTDEILTDDYDGKFEVKTRPLVDGYQMNIAPEGYYYKAHYRIPIREFSDIVNEGQHTIVRFNSATSSLIPGGEGYSVLANTDKNYYFQVNDSIYVYDENNKRHVGTITMVGGDNFTTIKFKIDLYINYNNIDKIKIFKPNSEMPATAYDFNDGSGIYRWRDIESFEFIGSNSALYDSVFTNGAHYIHQNINFFLRRQDPYGYYGLNPHGDDSIPYEYQILEQTGNDKDVTPAEHFIEGDIQLC